MLKRGERTMRDGRVLEDFEALVPLNPADFTPAWYLTPRAPFRTQAWHEMNEIWPTWITTRSFDVAMDAACRTLGPGVGAAMTVLDEGFNVVFGYVCFASTIVECGAPAWYGCWRAYDWLVKSGRVDPMDAAVWEVTAKERVR